MRYLEDKSCGILSIHVRWCELGLTGCQIRPEAEALVTWGKALRVSGSLTAIDVVHDNKKKSGYCVVMGP